MKNVCLTKACSSVARTAIQFVTCVLSVAALTLPAKAAVISIDARANIFAAGHASVPGGDGLLPPVLLFPAGQGQVVTFSGVTGLTDCVPIARPRMGPDGGACTGSIGTIILPANGISGIIHNSRQMFLAGVFLSENEPSDPAPSTLYFTSSNFTDLSPAVDQLFYVGDGLTGTGSGFTQEFHVPQDATRLFLGFADAFGFGSPFNNPIGLPPSSYLDNTGAILATVSISTVPEPSSGLLIAAGIMLLVVKRVGRGRNLLG